MTRISQHAKKIPASIPTIRRLPSYLQAVKRYKAEGLTVISGTVIAEELELEAIQVRKDLAVTGIAGKPRVGYPVTELISAIEKFLNWNRGCRAIVVGAGNLGSALMGYQELKDHGLTLVAAFDMSIDKIGPRDNAPTVFPMNEMPAVVEKKQARLAILTVPAGVAQDVCDKLVAAGIRRIWNFSNVRLRVPDGVLVMQEDLSSGYAVLTVLRGVDD